LCWPERPTATICDDAKKPGRNAAETQDAQDADRRQDPVPTHRRVQTCPDHHGHYNKGRDEYWMSVIHNFLSDACRRHRHALFGVKGGVIRWDNQPKNAPVFVADGVWADDNAS